MPSTDLQDQNDKLRGVIQKPGDEDEPDSNDGKDSMRLSATVPTRHRRVRSGSRFINGASSEESFKWEGYGAKIRNQEVNTTASDITEIAQSSR